MQHDNKKTRRDPIATAYFSWKDGESETNHIQEKRKKGRESIQKESKVSYHTGIGIIAMPHIKDYVLCSSICKGYQEF